MGGFDDRREVFGDVDQYKRINKYQDTERGNDLTPVPDPDTTRDYGPRLGPPSLGLPFPSHSPITGVRPADDRRRGGRDERKSGRVPSSTSTPPRTAHRSSCPRCPPVRRSFTSHGPSLTETPRCHPKTEQPLYHPRFLRASGRVPYSTSLSPVTLQSLVSDTLTRTP